MRFTDSLERDPHRHFTSVDQVRLYYRWLRRGWGASCIRVEGTSRLTRWLECCPSQSPAWKGENKLTKSHDPHANLLKREIKRLSEISASNIPSHEQLHILNLDGLPLCVSRIRLQVVRQTIEIPLQSETGHRIRAPPPRAYLRSLLR